MFLSTEINSNDRIAGKRSAKATIITCRKYDKYVGRIVNSKQTNECMLVKISPLTKSLISFKQYFFTDH